MRRNAVADMFRSELDKGLADGSIIQHAGCRVKVYDNDSGRPCVKVWYGNRAEPTHNLYFRSIEQRDKWVEETIRSAAESEEARNKWKEEAKAKRLSVVKGGADNITPKDYLDAPTVAILIRAALKETFPGVKFSVRSDSYSGGASIDITWLDGPTTKAVESVTNNFSGVWFDGMDDSTHHIRHSLDGQPVSFGSHYIHSLREHSDVMIEWAIEMVWDKYRPDFEKPSVEDFKQGRTWSTYPVGNARGEMHWSTQSCIHRELAEIDWFGESKESKTLKRVG